MTETTPSAAAGSNHNKLQWRILAGFVVLEAETAEHGLEMLEQKPVGVLFTDIRLPGQADGWDLAEKALLLHAPPDAADRYAAACR